MKHYEVVLLAGPDTMPFDVDADSHCIEKPDVKTGTSSYSNESPLFIVFYRHADITIDPFPQAEDPAGEDTSAPAEAHIEVFRAPLHQLLAVRLVDDEDEDE